jgi:hypothetical protein
MSHHYPLASTAPLCPAGHLPHRGGDQLGAHSADPFSLAAKSPKSRGVEVMQLVISPLVGEMPGRAEGGNSNRKANNSPSTAGTSASKDETR